MSSLSTDVPKHIAPALLQALKVCIVRFFTIPWAIWSGSGLRLAALGNRSAEDSAHAQKSEFPVFDWLRNAWDGIIFLSWFVCAFLAVISLIVQMSSRYGSIGAGIGSAVGILLAGYFQVILMSLIKESLIMFLSIALNVEKLANRKSS